MRINQIIGRFQTLSNLLYLKNEQGVSAELVEILDLIIASIENSIAHAAESTLIDTLKEKVLISVTK